MRSLTPPSRSFAFVEYLTAEEAKAAFEALGSSTHLYGRRLALEFAKEEESVDDMRAKTARDVAARGAAPPRGKRIKFDE